MSFAYHRQRQVVIESGPTRRALDDRYHVDFLRAHFGVTRSADFDLGLRTPAERIKALRHAAALVILTGPSSEDPLAPEKEAALLVASGANTLIFMPEGLRPVRSDLAKCILRSEVLVPPAEAEGVRARVAWMADQIRTPQTEARQGVR